MEEEEDSSQPPLEDEEGYMQCNVGRSDNTARKLPAPQPRKDVVVLAEFLSAEHGHRLERELTMDTRKRSKSFERVSVFSVRPEPGAVARRSPGLRVDGRHRQQAAISGPPAAASPAPRVPPRPDEQLLNKFQLQKAAFSSGRPAARRKYVEIDVREEERGARGSPRPARSRPAPPRTSYVVLQIDEAGGPSTRSAPVSPAASRAVLRDGGGREGRRVPVKRCKSNVSDRSLAAPARPQSLQPAAFPTSHHSQQHTALSLAQQPQSHLPLPRKPRKISAPNPLSSSPFTTAHRPYLYTRAVSTDSAPTGPSEPNLFSEQVKQDESESVDSLHIIDLRSGVTTILGDKSPLAPSRTSATPHAQRPPPPVRKPPCRPPGPTPRPRKPPGKVDEPPDLEPYVEMAPGVPQADLSRPVISGSPQQLLSNSAKNTTPLPRQSWGQSPREVEKTAKERVPSPSSEPEDFGAYSYVDLVRNRPLLFSSSSTAAEPPVCTPVAPGNTGVGGDTGSLSVYTPLNFSDSAMDEPGGVYTSPEVVDTSLTPPPESGSTHNNTSHLTNSDTGRKSEPLYMMPGDHIFFADSEAAVSLTTPETYTSLTTITKLEESMYAVRVASPTPLTSSS